MRAASSHASSLVLWNRAPPWSSGTGHLPSPPGQVISLGQVIIIKLPGQPARLCLIAGKFIYDT